MAKQLAKEIGYVYVDTGAMYRAVTLYAMRQGMYPDEGIREAELKEASHRGLIDRHVYALGGMNIDTVRIAKDLGFGGVVISGDLWNRFNIHQELDYQELIDHFKKLRKVIG
jgi:thiamine-phosphate pyrophosphorylase